MEGLCDHVLLWSESCLAFMYFWNAIIVWKHWSIDYHGDSGFITTLFLAISLDTLWNCGRGIPHVSGGGQRTLNCVCSFLKRVKRELIWFWLSDTSPLGLTFWCSVHNGLISTHLDVKKEKKIHLEKFAVNLRAYLAEVILWYNIVKRFIEPFCSMRAPISITSSRFYQYNRCLDSNFPKCLSVSKWQML